MATSTRKYELDALRILACFMIVVLHSPMPTEDSNGILLSCLSYLCITGVGIFFMLSGYLLLPTHEDTISFLKRRTWKLIWPTLIWSGVYLVIYHFTKGLTPTLGQIMSLPWGSFCPIMWFLYALIGLYLIVPIISPWLEKAGEKEAKLYFWLFIVVFCFPILELIPGLNTNTTTAGAWFYFCGYGGYFYIGWFMKRFPDYIKLKYIIAVIALAFISGALFKWFNIEIDFFSLYLTRSIFVLAIAIFLLKIFLGLKDKIGTLSPKCKKRLATMSGLTFGIYLMHFAIIRNFLWNIPFIAEIGCYPLQIAILAITGFFLSTVICYLISLSKFGKYIIGYSTPL